jgi:hypothetical protein
MKRLFGSIVLVGAVALSVFGFSGTANAAVRNGPTTRDCSFAGGLDPDFVQLSGVDVTPGGQLVAIGSSVQIIASESPERVDQMGHVKLAVTVTGPVAIETLNRASVGHVLLNIGLPTAGTYTISWKAVFDNGFHSCPNGFIPNNTRPRPFVVLVP